MFSGGRSENTEISSMVTIKFWLLTALWLYFPLHHEVMNCYCSRYHWQLTYWCCIQQACCLISATASSVENKKGLTKVCQCNYNQSPEDVIRAKSQNVLYVKTPQTVDNVQHNIPIIITVVTSCHSCLWMLTKYIMYFYIFTSFFSSFYIHFFITHWPSRRSQILQREVKQSKGQFC